MRSSATAAALFAVTLAGCGAAFAHTLTGGGLGQGPSFAAGFRHPLGGVFLNASMASAFCLYALGRALICEKPNFLRARIDCLVRHGEPELLIQPHDPPTHHAMDRSDRA